MSKKGKKESKDHFEVKPNFRAYRYCLLFFVISIITICIMVYGLAVDAKESELGYIILFCLLLSIGALSGILLGINIIGKRVVVSGDNLVITRPFFGKSHISLEDIQEYAFETHVKVGHDNHLIVIKYAGKVFFIQDAFMKNYDMLARYLRTNVDFRKDSTNK